MTIERGALQRIAVGHAVVLPLLVQFFEGQFAIGLERVDDPDVLVKYLSWFHDCKGTAFFRETSIINDAFCGIIVIKTLANLIFFFCTFAAEYKAELITIK